MPVIPTSSPAFATATNLETYLQRTFDAAETEAAELILDLVSAAIRSYTGQHITEATTTDRLKVKAHKVRLPQGPVTAVTGVADTNGTALTVTWFSGPTVWVSSSYVFSTDTLYDGPSYVDVTYTHGYGVVPDDIRAITLQVAGRSFGSTADTTGVESESIGGYSYSMGAAAAQGAVGFLAGERAVLDRYKLPASPIVMERA